MNTGGSTGMAFSRGGCVSARNTTLGTTHDISPLIPDCPAAWSTLFSASTASKKVRLAGYFAYACFWQLIANATSPLRSGVMVT